MNVEFTSVFKKYESGNSHIQIPSLIIKEMGLKHGDEMSIDCVDKQIIIRKKKEAQKK